MTDHVEIPRAPRVPRFDVVHAEREGTLVAVVIEVERETRRVAYVSEAMVVSEMRGGL